MRQRDKIIAALDVDNIELCSELVGKLYPTIKIFKVGSQLFTSGGQDTVAVIKRRGASCFLDLKFHDIPAAVGGAASSATKLGADMFDIHASGGLEMMRSAAESAEHTAQKLKLKKPLILGVTVLTSMDKRDLEVIGIKRHPKEEVLYLSELARKARLDGVIASPDEIEAIKKNFGRDFLVITPGIRPSWTEKADQKRVASPKEAFDRGADYIVIGRPITESENPRDAAERIIEEIE